MRSVNTADKELIQKAKMKKIIFGGTEKGGILSRIMIYGILTGLGFVYIYPLIYMLSLSLMSTSDLVDATVTWIPTSLSRGSFIKAYETLNVLAGLKDSFIMSLIPALLQTVILAFAGYGMARLQVPFKKMWLVLMVVAFLIPTQVTLIPRYLLFSSYQLLKTIWPTYLMSALGQGVKSSIFFFIYYQFFQSYPKSLDEAAQIDGASRLTVFIKIAIPMARPAIVVSYLFSFIWFWNETTQTSQLSAEAVNTLPMRLESFAVAFSRIFSSAEISTGGALNESIRLAGTLITIAPLLLLYILLQRYFVEGVERTGITGE